MLRRLIRKIIYILNIITSYQLDKFTGYMIEKHRFFIRKGYKLNLKEPRSFCEKVVWKKINDRNPLLPLTADKYLVRNYVKEKLGEEKTEEILIPLLFVTDDPGTIPFDDLPLNYVVKPNHASGKVLIVRNSYPGRDEIISRCKQWLARPYDLDKKEWAYRNIDRKILIEKLLLNESGFIPDDYKFLMFDGKCRLIEVCSDRQIKGNTKYKIYNERWEEVDATFKGNEGPLQEKPSSLDYMLHIAEKLSAPFDFVRVDLYSINNKVYFGELTHYPSSGWTQIEPVDFDFQLGKYWDLKRNYWVKD